MFFGANIISLVGLVCTVLGVIVAIINLEKHPRVRGFLLVVVCGTVATLLWNVTRGFSRGDSAIAFQRLAELQKKAREDVDREYKAQQQAEEAEKERAAYESARQAAWEQHALQEAKIAILGTWKCSTGAKMTFREDGTASALGITMYTYRFMNSKHFVMNGYWGLGPGLTYDVDLTGPNRSVSWRGVICHHE